MKQDAVPAGATGVITIDLGQLGANWQALAKLVHPAQCGAVVKANAYGLGADRVVPALARAGCRTFFIATATEAHAARRLVPSATLFALDGLLPGAGSDLRRAGAVPVLSSLAEVREWASLVEGQAEKVPTALHVDTGLNRLGMPEHEVEELVRDSRILDRLDVRLVMSHLVSADDPEDPRNERQLAAFERLRGRLPRAPASLAASDGLMLGARYHFDLVRPGYALYGGQAFRGGPTPVGPVVRVSARILQIRDVAPGETVGYSASWRARRASRVAVVAAGYADGLPRSLSAPDGHAGGMIAIRGRPAPIVGRVSMDLITVDVTELGDLALERGELVDLIGPGLTIEAMGSAAGTIGYEVLTRLGPRFPRVYVDEAG
ncbi:MAG TPA: alanine racemase [Hyphomicrobiaceae bacterium]|nr:alanine racemase [Hyphomicrobiaceae bacterium]